jgi:putative transcriptional regulator
VAGLRKNRVVVIRIHTVDDTIEQQPLIEQGEECICLVLTEGPLRFKSLASRMVQPLIGL